MGRRKALRGTCYYVIWQGHLESPERSLEFILRLLSRSVAPCLRSQLPPSPLLSPPVFFTCSRVSPFRSVWGSLLPPPAVDLQTWTPPPDGWDMTRLGRDRLCLPVRLLLSESYTPISWGGTTVSVALLLS